MIGCGEAVGSDFWTLLLNAPPPTTNWIMGQLNPRLTAELRLLYNLFGSGHALLLREAPPLYG